MSSTGNGERRQSILSRVGELELRPTTLPGKDGPVDVLVRELSAKQARQFEVLLAKQAPDPIGFLLQQSLVDPETKELIFEDGDRSAIESLGIAGLKEALKITQELNGIEENDIAKAMELLRQAPPTG